MAKLEAIIGITHNPFMPRLFKQANRPPGCARVIERIEMMPWPDSHSLEELL